MSYFKNKVNNFLEYYVVPQLTSYVRKQKQLSFENIGINTNGKNAPKALIIYVSSAIPYYIKGDVFSCPIINSHALYWHAAEIVRILNQQGYVVDFIDSSSINPKIEWTKYQLVIDERNNLINSQEVNGQIKVFYATGLKYDFQNNAEIKRVHQFHDRNSLWINPARIASPTFSDQIADYMLFYGNENWMNLYSQKPIRHQLNMSVTYVPKKISRDYSKKDFMWMGSLGPIHKGLDLAIEAFENIPEARLHIFGSIESDIIFMGWMKKKLKKFTNIIYHGIAQINSPEFITIAESCIGHIFPSCSEGGPGSVAQTSHFGIIPIVTNTANVRGADLGYIIDTNDSLEIISEIQDRVKNILQLSENELKQKADNVIEFARKYHTREAYSGSFTDFTLKLNA